MEFEWDASKAAANRRKHGVSFEEASDAFALTGPDVVHSDFESRERTLGRSRKERLLVVISVREGNVTWIISARKATRREVQLYEKTIKERLRDRQ